MNQGGACIGVGRGRSRWRARSEGVHVPVRRMPAENGFLNSPRKPPCSARRARVELR